MDESPSDSVQIFDNSDPDMQRAYAIARATFRFLWREIARDRRRIVPALDLACVKAPFSDNEERTDGAPSVEHMWLSEIDFDGRSISGVLMNSPNWVTSVEEGDSVRVPLDQISDWLFAISDKAYGGFTVNLLRSRMDEQTRFQHDEAWGLDFGDPLNPRSPSDSEHQRLCENLAEMLRKHLTKDPSQLSVKDPHGWTLLHHEASAGGVATVQVLLAAGADASAKNALGMTPQDLARDLGWDDVADLLKRQS